MLVLVILMNHDVQCSIRIAIRYDLTCTSYLFRYIISNISKKWGSSSIMAMIKCPECGKEISDKSNNCVYCGCPAKFFETKKKLVVGNVLRSHVVSNDSEKVNNVPGKKKLSKKSTILLAVVVIALIIVYAIVDNSNKEKVETTPKETAKVETERKTDPKNSSTKIELSNKPKDGELLADNLNFYLVYLEVPYSQSGLQNTSPWNAMGTAFHLEDTYFLDQQCTVSVWYSHQDTNECGSLELNIWAANSAESKKFSQMRDMLINKYDITLLEDDKYHISFKIPDTEYICKIYAVGLGDYADNVEDILIVNE